MPLRRVPAPFDHPDWVFEIEYDGFRALSSSTPTCRSSRVEGSVYNSFPTLAAELARVVPRQAILDGEIVALDAEGKLLHLGGGGGCEALGACALS